MHVCIRDDFCHIRPLCRVQNSKPDLLSTLSIVPFGLKIQFHNFPTFPNSIHPRRLSQRIIMCLGKSELFRCEDTFSEVCRAVICPVGFSVQSSLRSELIKSHIAIMENDRATACSDFHCRILFCSLHCCPKSVFILKSIPSPLKS